VFGKIILKTSRFVELTLGEPKITFFLDKFKFYGMFGNRSNSGSYHKFINSMKNKTRFKGNKLISAKEIIDRFHITYQTINHYTDFGLLPLVFKKGNVRFYDSKQVKQRLNKITELASEGYSLRLIRKKLIGI